MPDDAAFLWVAEEDSSFDPTAAPPRQDVRIDGLPGEVGLWIFILGDMTIFGLFFSVFAWEGRHDRDLFAHSTHDLLQPVGVVNTLILLASSYLVVLALNAHRQHAPERARRLRSSAVLCALAFAAVKAFEYTHGLNEGHTPTSNAFFTFYFVMTGVHLLHVLIGAVLLLVWRAKAASAGSTWESGRGLAEAAAVYWHMVDLLWVIIFTLLYLVFAA